MIDNLLKYQDVDATLRKIELELSGSEERKKAISAKKYLDGVNENVEKLDNKAKELISAYESTTKEQLKLEEQETEFKNAIEELEDDKGAEFLLKKVDELLNQIKYLGDKATKINQEIQAVLKEYATLKNNTKLAQAQYVEFGKKYNDLKNSKEEEMNSIKKELEKIKKTVDANLMDRYLKKRAEKIFPIVFEVSNEVCGACNMQLSMNELSKLKNGEIIDCDQCRRMLYKK